MTEKIVIRVEVDGMEVYLIELGEGREDYFYKDDIAFFSMGRLFNKERTIAPYDYVFRLCRHKTEEEKPSNRSTRK